MNTLSTPTQIPLRRVIYTSRALMSPDDLAMLMIQAHGKNKRLEITGLLFHHEGHIMQLLEGPADAVGSLLASIRQDHRHTHFKVQLESTDTLRLFPDWSMASMQLSAVSFRQVLESLNDVAHPAIQVLRDFAAQHGVTPD